MPLMLDFDSTAELPANFIQNESHVIGGSTTRYWVLAGGCFFTKGLILRRASDNYILQPGLDYKALHFVASAAEETGKEVCAIIMVHNTAITGEILQDYHAVGGTYSATVEALEELLENLAAVSGNDVAWGQIVGAPAQFPPTPHGHHLADWYGLGGLITKLEELRQANLQGDIATIQMIYQYINNAIDAAISSVSGTDAGEVNQLITLALNAHKSANGEHTKESVGLGNVPNWTALSDIDANVDGVAGKNTHFMNAVQILSLIQNRVTKTWLGLENIPNYGVATDTEVDTGTAANKLMVPAGTQRAILNMTRVGNTAASAANILTPFFVANFADTNPPTDVTSGGVTGLGIQFFHVAKGAALTVTTQRTQLVMISGGTNAKGLWIRSHNGTSWSAYAPAGSPTSVGLGNITNDPEATEAEAFEGTAANRRITARRARQAAIGAVRHVGAMNTQDPNTTLLPSILATGENCPTGLEGSLRGDSFAIQTIFNPDNANEINAVTMKRTQIAYGRNITGVWSRVFTDGSWSLWHDIASDETERCWANANAGVFDNKLYDRKSRCTAVSMMAGLRVKAIVQDLALADPKIFIQLTLNDRMHRRSALTTGYGSDGEWGVDVGSARLDGSYAPVTKIVQLERLVPDGHSSFFVRKIEQNVLTTAVSTKQTSELSHMRGMDGNIQKIITTTAGTTRISLIDVLRSQMGFVIALFREQSTGTIGVMFSRYSEQHSSDPREWGFGVPLTDNTSPTFATLLGILGEATVSNRGTWHGTGLNTYTMNSLANTLKFRETTFGKYLSAYTIGEELYLVFTGGVVMIELDSDFNWMELTGIGISTSHIKAGATSALAYNGPYNSSGPRFSTFMYPHVNDARRLIAVDETGNDGMDTVFTKTPAVVGGYNLTSTTRPFILRTDDLGLAPQDRKILAIGYSGGLIWAAVGNYDSANNVNQIHQLTAVPWDPLKTKNNILHLKTIYWNPLVWEQMSPTMQTTPIVVSDNSGHRLHLLGDGGYPWNCVLTGYNGYRVGDVLRERY